MRHDADQSLQLPATAVKGRDHLSRYSAPLQVGSEVARRARGLGLTVIAYDPYASEEKARAQVTGRRLATAAARPDCAGVAAGAAQQSATAAAACEMVFVPSRGAVQCAQGVTLMSLDDCLAKAEFFSLHMPLTPQTKVPAAVHDHSPLLLQQCTSGHESYM